MCVQMGGRSEPPEGIQELTTVVNVGDLAMLSTTTLRDPATPANRNAWTKGVPLREKRHSFGAAV
jgi:hypothetical protein